MANLNIRVPHIRHLRRAMRIPFGRRRLAKTWFDQQSTDLAGTGTGQTFTVDAAGTASSGVLTLTGNAVDAETVTVGGVTYTFQTTLVDVANNVLIGALATDSIDNLIAAINAGAGVGTLYGTGTVVNPDASAAAGAGDTMDLTALVVGVAGDLIATTETMTAGSFGGATLSGGVEPDRVIITAHGYASGNGPFVLTATDTLPAGLVVDTPYWPGVLGVNDFKLFLTQDQALRDLAPIDITDAGTGTHTITPSTRSVDLVEKVRQGDVSTERLNTLTDIDDIT